MKKAPLAPVNYHFPEVSVKALMTYQAGAPTDTFLDAEISHAELLDNGYYYVQIRVRSDIEKSTNPPYQFDVVAYGVFLPSDEKATQSFAAVQQAAMVLIGATRELIMTLTAKGPWPSYILPAVILDKPSEVANAELGIPSDTDI